MPGLCADVILCRQFHSRYTEVTFCWEGLILLVDDEMDADFAHLT